MGLEKQLKESNECLRELIIISKKTKRTLTMVNIINTITLIVIALLMFRGSL